MSNRTDQISRLTASLSVWAVLALAAFTAILYVLGVDFSFIELHPGNTMLVLLGTFFLALILGAATAQIKRIQDTTQELSQDYEALLNITPDGVIISDAKNRITMANRQAELLFGYGPGQMQGLSTETLVPESERASHIKLRDAFFREFIPRRLGTRLMGERLCRADGSEFFADISLGPLQTPNGKAALAIVQDTTAHVVREKERGNITRALRLLSDVSRIIRTSTNEADLFHDVCQTIVSEGDYPLAWIGRREQDEKRSVSVVARYGEDDEGYLDKARITWSDAPSGQGPAGVAIRTGRPLIIRSTQPDPLYQPCLDVAAKSGFMSVAGFPMTVDSTTEGVIIICSKSIDAFGAEEYVLLQDLSDEVAHAVSALRSAASRRETELALRRGEATLERAQEIAHIGSWEWDLESGIQRWSKETCHLFDLDSDTADPSLALLLSRTHPDDQAHVKEKIGIAKSGDVSSVKADFRVVREDGATRWIHVQAEVEFHDTGPYRVVGVMQDVSERRHFEDQLAQIASHDELTGLPNRHLLNDRLEQGLSHHRYTNRLLGLLFVDLDRFKLVNDTLGHDAGDQLLKEIANRLSTCLREGDTVARQGGDEFVVILNDLAKAEDAAFVAQKMLDSLTPPCYLFGHEVVPAASLGIAVYPRDGNTMQELMMSADKAMYAAKQAGRGQYRFFDVEMNRAASDWLEVGVQLHHALERNEFEVHYQPKVDFKTGLITGAEALLRWRNAELGMIGPDRFIPILEETGRILEVGEWVIVQACRQVRLWQEQGLASLRVAVNLSPRQFQQRDLVARIRGIIEQENIFPSHLELEITESMIMQNVDRTIVVLQELRVLGVNLAIDDFGTGYSSLSALKRFPVDCLKIDRSFVNDISTDPDDRAITRAIILLAHSMGLSVVAEGVETEAQRIFLVEAGCDEMQGYLYAKPMPAAQMDTLLTREIENVKRYHAALNATNSVSEKPTKITKVGETTKAA